MYVGLVSFLLLIAAGVLAMRSVIKGLRREHEDAIEGVQRELRNVRNEVSKLYDLGMGSERQRVEMCAALGLEWDYGQPPRYVVKGKKK